MKGEQQGGKEKREGCSPSDTDRDRDVPSGAGGVASSPIPHLERHLEGLEGVSLGARESGTAEVEQRDSPMGGDTHTLVEEVGRERERAGEGETGVRATGATRAVLYDGLFRATTHSSPSDECPQAARAALPFLVSLATEAPLSVFMDTLAHMLRINMSHSLFSHALRDMFTSVTPTAWDTAGILRTAGTSAVLCGIVRVMADPPTHVIGNASLSPTLLLLVVYNLLSSVSHERAGLILLRAMYDTGVGPDLNTQYIRSLSPSQHFDERELCQAAEAAQCRYGAVDTAGRVEPVPTEGERVERVNDVWTGVVLDPCVIEWLYQSLGVERGVAAPPPSASVFADREGEGEKVAVETEDPSPDVDSSDSPSFSTESTEVTVTPSSEGVELCPASESPPSAPMSTPSPTVPPSPAPSASGTDPAATSSLTTRLRLIAERGFTLNPSIHSIRSKQLSGRERARAKYYGMVADTSEDESGGLTMPTAVMKGSRPMCNAPKKIAEIAAEGMAKGVPAERVAKDGDTWAWGETPDVATTTTEVTATPAAPPVTGGADDADVPPGLGQAVVSPTETVGEVDADGEAEADVPPGLGVSTEAVSAPVPTPLSTGVVSDADALTEREREDNKAADAEPAALLTESAGMDTSSSPDVCDVAEGGVSGEVGETEKVEPETVCSTETEAVRETAPITEGVETAVPSLPTHAGTEAGSVPGTQGAETIPVQAETTPSTDTSPIATMCPSGPEAVSDEMGDQYTDDSLLDLPCVASDDEEELLENARAALQDTALESIPIRRSTHMGPGSTCTPVTTTPLSATDLSIVHESDMQYRTRRLHQALKKQAETNVGRERGSGRGRAPRREEWAWSNQGQSSAGTPSARTPVCQPPRAPLKTIMSEHVLFRDTPFHPALIGGAGAAQQSWLVAPSTSSAICISGGTVFHQKAALPTQNSTPGTLPAPRLSRLPTPLSSMTPSVLSGHVVTHPPLPHPSGKAMPYGTGTTSMYSVVGGPLREKGKGHGGSSSRCGLVVYQSHSGSDTPPSDTTGAAGSTPPGMDVLGQHIMPDTQALTAVAPLSPSGIQGEGMVYAVAGGIQRTRVVKSGRGRGSNRRDRHPRQGRGQGTVSSTVSCGVSYLSFGADGSEASTPMQTALSGKTPLPDAATALCPLGDTLPHCTVATLRNGGVAVLDRRVTSGPVLYFGAHKGVATCCHGVPSQSGSFITGGSDGRVCLFDIRQTQTGDLNPYPLGSMLVGEGCQTGLGPLCITSAVPMLPSDPVHAQGGLDAYQGRPFSIPPDPIGLALLKGVNVLISAVRSQRVPPPEAEDQPPSTPTASKDSGLGPLETTNVLYRGVFRSHIAQTMLEPDFVLPHLSLHSVVGDPNVCIVRSDMPVMYTWPRTERGYITSLRNPYL
ncbi:hypothetical protein KIPB_004031 [Kipferlia bialata]|uniref:Uncharacterized protein n=1 Tax=Kipferlia bialata TaxID=797122 RepID=A0A9K3CUP6_9EUKA|nr:hypothetical protein KIPB_004031 [Kipferlia bialata]|eukprot:g4031.t1